MRMEKKQYQSPSVRVMEVKQKQVLCASGNTERLSGDDFYWGGSSTESLNEEKFGW